MQKPTLEKVTELAKMVRDAGLTPFDLLSWIYLLDLECKTAESEEFIDLEVHFTIRKLIREALQRKAEMLDTNDQTDIHQRIIQNLQRK